MILSSGRTAYTKPLERHGTVALVSVTLRIFAFVWASVRGLFVCAQRIWQRDHGQSRRPCLDFVDGKCIIDSGGRCNVYTINGRERVGGGAKFPNIMRSVTPDICSAVEFDTVRVTVLNVVTHSH